MNTTRANEFPDKRLSFIHEIPGSKSRAEAFLADFFNSSKDHLWGRYNPAVSYQHLCPYFSGAAFSTANSTIFVGRTEALSESLTALGKAAGLDVDLSKIVSSEAVVKRWSIQHHDGETHDSEEDLVANMEKQAMLKVLSQSPQFINMLVTRYRQDICLFGYNQTRCPDDPHMAKLAARIKFLA
jgi:hypothetical protein